MAVPPWESGRHAPARGSRFPLTARPVAATTTAGTTTGSAGWQQAKDLAEVAWPLLVNRTDVWGAYIHPDRRPVRTRADGSTFTQNSYTAPAKADRGVATLSPAILIRHFAGRCPSHTIGLHTTSPEVTSRWGLVEVDRHGDDGDAEANWRAIEHWAAVCASLGFTPWVTDSNGAGGYHLRVVFDAPVPTATVYRFLQWLVRDHADHGLAAKPETYPKQPGLTGLGFGNWVRLPGRHHTRDHWSRFWIGDAWVAWPEAVPWLLAFRPDPASLLPDIPEPEPPTPRAAPPPVRPSAVGRRLSDREVALRALAGIPNHDLHFDEWIAVGMALHTVDSGVGMRDAWVDWSRRSGKHTDGECERRWPSFSGGEGRRHRIGTLIALSRRAGHEPFPQRRQAPLRSARKDRPDAAPPGPAEGRVSAAAPSLPPIRFNPLSAPGPVVPAGPVSFVMRPNVAGGDL